MQKECGMKGKKGFHKGMKRGGGMMMFSQLELSAEQQHKLSILRDEMRLEMKKQMGPKKRGNMQKFITADGFDKAGFLKEMNERHTKMSELKATHMEKAFAIPYKRTNSKTSSYKVIKRGTCPFFYSYNIAQIML